MLNMTIPVVPSQPNQITPFTSTASQHGPAFRPTARLMLILPEPWEQRRVNLDLCSLIGIPLRASGAYEKKGDGFLKGGGGFLTDKGLFVIGIKEGPRDESSQRCKGVHLDGSQDGTLCKTPEEVRSAREFTQEGRGAVGRAGPRQSSRNADLCVIDLPV